MFYFIAINHTNYFKIRVFFGELLKSFAPFPLNYRTGYNKLLEPEQHKINVDYTMNNIKQSKIIRQIFLLVVVTTFLSACGTVRDATDWVPGVDSNEEIQRQKQQEERRKRALQKKEYQSKAAYVPIGPQAEIDAEISVMISKRYAEEPNIEAGEVGIDVHSGVVTLSGTVSSEAAAVKAISLAKSVGGVTRVISKLIIISVR